jgi:hypothetical protein
MKAVGTYKKFEFNQPQSIYVFSLQTLLAEFGVDYSVTPLIGIAGACWTWIRRRHISSLEGFALYLAWYLLFFLNHYYDTVMLIPLCSVAVALARRSRVTLVLVTGMMGALCLPLAHLIAQPELRTLELLLSLALLGFVLIAIENRIRSSESRIPADASHDDSIAWTAMTVSR